MDRRSDPLPEPLLDLARDGVGVEEQGGPLLGPDFPVEGGGLLRPPSQDEEVQDRKPLPLRKLDDSRIGEEGTQIAPQRGSGRLVGGAEIRHQDAHGGTLAMADVRGPVIHGGAEDSTELRVVHLESGRSGWTPGSKPCLPSCPSAHRRSGTERGPSRLRPFVQSRQSVPNRRNSRPIIELKEAASPSESRSLTRISSRSPSTRSMASRTSWTSTRHHSPIRLIR